MNYRYEVRWTQRRAKATLLPRRIIAESRQDALFMLAQAIKENAAIVGKMPKRISITLGAKDRGPSRIEWLKQ